MEYQIAKGVFDILPEENDPSDKWRESHLWRYVENIAQKTAEDFGFKEIRTPIFERTELFTRSVGEGTDIISKEMYTFKDKGDRLLSLRPEGTASVMRAFAEKKLHTKASCHKLFYLFSMFRYERQQAGRYRQHHQFGVEALGHESSFQDVEVIHLLVSFLARLGIKDFVLKINSIGDKECRDNYRIAFKNYLHPFFKDLSEDSQIRFEINPLRIWDSKNEKDQQILEKAPSILDYLDVSSQKHFQGVLSLLSDLNISYVVDPKLVRGLDYYNKTVFEVTSSALGAQNSLGGGGRYDGLLKKLGGPDLPSCGFGAGIERIIQTMLAQNVNLPCPPFPQIFLIPLGDIAENRGFKIISDLRQKGIPCEIDLSRKKLRNALRTAHELKARFVIILGEEELQSGTLELKEMATGQTKKMSFEDLEKWHIS